VLKSAALESWWGITLTAERLQAEVDRMAAHSQAPDVLRELLAALDHDPALAAECLARPLLADRLIRSHYARDDRFHGEIRARVRRELEDSGQSLVADALSATCTEVEWARGRSAAPGVIGLEPDAFDARVREVTVALGGPGGKVEIGRPVPLGEEESRFVALAALSVEADRVRLAVVEWPKRSFESWWGEARHRLPLRPLGTSFSFELRSPQASNCRDDSWQPTLQLLDPRYWHIARVDRQRDDRLRRHELRRDHLWRRQPL
jgi:hypothetical protein